MLKQILLSLNTKPVSLKIQSLKINGRQYSKPEPVLNFLKHCIEFKLFLRVLIISIKISLSIVDLTLELLDNQVIVFARSLF